MGWASFYGVGSVRRLGNHIGGNTVSMNDVEIANLKGRICFIRDFLSKRKTISCERVDNIFAVKTGYKTRRQFPRLSELSPFLPTNRWSGEKDCHYVFYFEIDTPDVSAGRRCELRFLTDKDIPHNPQFIIYDDGKPVQGIDNEHKEVIVAANKKHRIHAYCYGGALVEDTYSFDVYFAIVDEETEQLLYDVEYPLQWLETLESKNCLYVECLQILQTALRKIDLHAKNEEEFYTSVKEARSCLKETFYENTQFDNVLNEGEVIAAGHSHIDLAWLWTIKQSAEKIQHTASNMLPLMKQYPEYSFFSTQPALYEYLQKEDPDLYKEVKKAVVGGQWEPDGGFWVESDCNLPSGESFVRQLLYGKEYFYKEFKVDSKIAWLPDSFGFTASLPQILLKSGMEVFVTSKISWNDTNMQPNDLFRWRGIDGSEILSYFITTQEYVARREILNYTRYSGILNPSQVKGCFHRFRNQEICKRTLMPFGYGDGGGGTNRLQLETLRRMKKTLPEMPRVKAGRVDGFFKDMRKELDESKVPVWAGELYLELHRGTFTSGADIKKCNRVQELLFHNAELFSSINECCFNVPYPAENIKDAWKVLLTNQFHDLLSGTCIASVNQKAKKDYETIYCSVAPYYYDVLTSIAGKIKGSGNVVFNPNPFVADGVINTENGWRMVKNVPPNGYAVCEMQPVEHSVFLSERGMENEYFIVAFDEFGNIVRLYDKRVHRELLKEEEKLNIRAYEDVPFQYDAWEIKKDIYDKELPIRFCSIEPLREGCRAGFKIRKEIGDSEIVQQIFLYEKQSLLEFETNVQWNESGVALKAHFPLDINAQKVVNEIPFGYIQRELNDNTSWEQARFEVCMHKYLDLSEGDYGVAILNDCKYGYGIIGREINVSLLKSPTYPDPESERGMHYFRYALYAHNTGFDEADVLKQAYIYNNPLYAIERFDVETDEMPSSFSFVFSDRENAVVDCVKKSEDGQGYIVRLYESKNCRTKTKLRFGINVKKAVLCDLQENVLSDLVVKDNIVEITVMPFEIVTVKIFKA